MSRNSKRKWGGSCYDEAKIPIWELNPKGLENKRTGLTLGKP